MALSGRLPRRDDTWSTTIEGCLNDDATSPPPGVDGVSASLYVRWSTDAHDEQAIGAIEPVGFEASTREITAARNEVCPPGWSGTRCDAPHCRRAAAPRRSPSAVLRGLSTRTTLSDSTGGGTAEPISLAPDDDLWANSPPGSRTNASTPREGSWTDPEAVERRHITLQPTLPKTPSQEQRGHVHV